MDIITTFRFILSPDTAGLRPDKLFWRVAVTDTDSDGDGFNDYEEYQLGTDPSIADRDADGLPDEWEIAYNLDLDDDGSVNPDNGPNGDQDNDGLSNLDEYWYQGDPLDNDTDDDGLADGNEVFVHGTYVSDADSDSDGLEDGVEVGFPIPTDPLDRDSDDDTLSDGDEFSIHHTSPMQQDSDGDTLRDDWEIRYVFNPLDPADGPTDPDGDGLTNPAEQNYGSTRVTLTAITTAHPTARKITTRTALPTMRKSPSIPQIHRSH